MAIYGITFDGTNSAGTRTDDAVGLTWQRSTDTVAGTDDFASLAPFNVRECVTKYNSSTGKREVLGYKGDAGYSTLRADTTNDIMIEFPVFWYQRPSKYTWRISDTPESGFKPSPMHYHKGKLYDCVRVSKYAVNSSYISQTGQNPLTRTSMNTFRTNMRSKGQYMIDYSSYCSIVMLCLIKYANMDVQNTVGQGVSTGNTVIASGGADNVLGLDGSAGLVSDTPLSVITFGIENLYGNLWKFIDGLYGYNGYLYYKEVLDMVSDPSSSSDLTSNYTKINTAIVTSSGDISDIAYDTDYDFGIFPTAIGSPNPSGDYCWANSNFNCVAIGGNSNRGSYAGLFYFAVDNSVGISSYNDWGTLSIEFGNRINTSRLTLVSNDWTQLSNQDKEDLLDAAVEEFPTSAELESLGTFKVVSTYPHSTYMLNFMPKDKLVLPKATFGTNFENIDSVTITQTESGNGKVRYIITDDLTNYYTWDNANQEFVQISSLNAATVLSEGMTATTIGSLTTTDWNTFFDNTKGIGIGFALSINSTTDAAEIDNMSMQVDMRGKWKKAIHGTDYDYAYTSNELLTVTLNANGTYKINYPISSNS